MKTLLRSLTDMVAKKTPLRCFVHMERAGGTTFVHVLRNNDPTVLMLSPYRWPHEPNNVFKKDELNVLLRLFPRTGGFSGHCTRSYLDYGSVTDRPIQYVTFLRDPIKRYMSHYFHERFAKSNGWDLDTFLSDKRFDNFMTVRLAGRADLDEAKRRLAEDFHFVGLTDRFDASLVLLRQLWGEDFDIRYEKKNDASSNAYTEARQECLSRRDELHEKNALDAELYAFAVDLFEERAEASGLNLDAEVEALQAANATFTYPKWRGRAAKAYRWAGYKWPEEVLRAVHHPDDNFGLLQRVAVRVSPHFERRWFADTHPSPAGASEDASSSRMP